MLFFLDKSKLLKIYFSFFNKDLRCSLRLLLITAAYLALTLFMASSSVRYSSAELPMALFLIAGLLGDAFILVEL